MDTLRIQTERHTLFPLVYIPPLQMWMQWLPLTKIQVEYFLCITRDATFDSNWYERLMRGNDRVSPYRLQRDNYWGAIATNILPREAESIANWLGGRLMQQDEWQATYQWAKAQSADPTFATTVSKHDGLSARAARLVNAMETAADTAFRGQTRTLADQMLLRGGVLEYVYTDSSRNQFGGLGKAATGLYSTMATPESGLVMISNPRDGSRYPHFGTRLLTKRGSA